MTYKYTAIIIEPRKIKALEFVLHNICDCLSNEWKIIFFHGTNNIEYGSKIVEKLNKQFENRISMVNLNVDDLYGHVVYSKILATKTIIYDYIDTEMFLLFQTDSMIIKQNAHLINNFLEYDYVGAPWLICDYPITKNCDFIGNGGFSLRNKNKMLEIIEKIKWNDIHEDLYFATKYDNIDVKKPEYNKACTFCVDEVFSELAFACHQIYIKPFYETFKNLYPEIEILQSLQYNED